MRAQCIPTVVEPARELVDPFLVYVVWRVHGGRREVTEEGLVRCRRTLPLDPRDRLVGEIFGEVIPGSTDVRRDRSRLVVDGWFPLRRLGSHDSVEAVEAHSGWPTIERPGGALFPRRCEMPLAEARGAVARHAKYLCDGCRLGRNCAVVSGERIRDLGDTTHVNRVVVPAGEQCRAGGRAECGGVELVVLQSALCHVIEAGRWDGSAECAERSEAHVVEHDQQDVGCLFRCAVGDESSGHRIGDHAIRLTGERGSRAGKLSVRHRCCPLSGKESSH